MKTVKYEEKRGTSRRVNESILKSLSKLSTTALLGTRRNARVIAILVIISCVLVLIAHTSDNDILSRHSGGKVSSYSKSVVRTCRPDPSYGLGRSYDARVRGVNVTYSAWTGDKYFEHDVVAIRTHEAVRMMSKLKRSATILDVGANMGKVTFPILAMAQTHTVIAIEPVTFNVDHLCMTANLNGWLGHAGFLLLKAALSDREGTMEIFVPQGREDNAALSESAATANVGGKDRGESVTLLTGDKLLREGGFNPDLIKIDTQGHELFVLRGLREYMEKAEPGELVIMAESDPKLMHMSGVNPKDIYQLMVVELGYKAYCRPDIDVEDERFVVKGSPLSYEQYPPGGCRDIFYYKTR
ncbi:S-adenosyl-L-methionine-dependent methyltransferase [Gracilaria domingensis]|nr:S-adenosyl-L-methionine-dependent methyltransferase [Gracilaria domingensis]